MEKYVLCGALIFGVGYYTLNKMISADRQLKQALRSCLTSSGKLTIRMVIY